MFVKFNENGKVESYADVEKLEDIRPESDGFEEISGFAQEDLEFLKKENGIISIDYDLKSSVTAKRESYKTYIEHKKRLRSLSEDIIQLICGEDVPNIEAKKAEFISIHNTVRVYEGKEIRNKL